MRKARIQDYGPRRFFAPACCLNHGIDKQLIMLSTRNQDKLQAICLELSLSTHSLAEENCTAGVAAFCKSGSLTNKCYYPT